MLRDLNPSPSHDRERRPILGPAGLYSAPTSIQTQGFGFISPNGGGPDVFVHQSEIKRDGFRFLEKGETVEFRVEEGETGRQRAFNVTGARLL